VEEWYQNPSADLHLWCYINFTHKCLTCPHKPCLWSDHFPGLHPKVPSGALPRLKNSYPWEIVKKGHPGARSSRLCRVRWRVRPFWILCTQPLPAFLQEAVSRTWTRDLMFTRQQLYRVQQGLPLLFSVKKKQLYRCARAPLHPWEIVNWIKLNYKLKDAWRTGWRVIYSLAEVPQLVSCIVSFVYWSSSYRIFF
jgi:hypothetical protein